jgi:GWxTD domain-containing protein
MKKSLLILINLLLFQLNNINASGKIEAYFSYSTFYSPKEGPYIETYFSLIGNSFTYISAGKGLILGKAELSIIVKQKDIIKDFRKVIVSTPIVSDTTRVFSNLIDQQRLALPNGTYELEIELKDINNIETSPLRLSEKIIINFPDDKISISGIQFIESYLKVEKPGILTKSGYNLIPYVSDFFPKSMNSLIFYGEVYNADKALGNDEKFLINYYIETSENNVVLNNYKKFNRRDANEVNIVFGEFPIEELPSGNYNFVIEVKDRENNTLVVNKAFFQRSNALNDLNLADMDKINIETSFVSRFTSKDTLAEYIRSLRPISISSEKIFADNQLKTADIQTMQQYFLFFWTNRNRINPEKAWNDYYENVKKVNQLYGTKIKKGYEADRGRVYLQYGPPNATTQQLHEPSAYPYEIWHYYRINQFNNRRFIFYNPDLATNDFPLLHSDMIGEINNPTWQMMLHRRDNRYDYNIDQEKVTPHFGGNSDDFFLNPR